MFNLITSIERTCYVTMHVISVYGLVGVFSNTGKDKI